MNKNFLDAKSLAKFIYGINGLPEKINLVELFSVNQIFYTTFKEHANYDINYLFHLENYTEKKFNNLVANKWIDLLACNLTYSFKKNSSIFKRIMINKQTPNALITISSRLLKNDDFRLFLKDLKKLGYKIQKKVLNQTIFISLTINKINPLLSNLLNVLKYYLKNTVPYYFSEGIIYATPDYNKKLCLKEKTIIRKLRQYPFQLSTFIVSIIEKGKFGNSPHNNILSVDKNFKEYSKNWKNYGRVNLKKMDEKYFDFWIKYLLKELDKPNYFVNRVNFANNTVQEEYIADIKSSIKSFKESEISKKLKKKSQKRDYQNRKERVLLNKSLTNAKNSLEKLNNLKKPFAIKKKKLLKKIFLLEEKLKVIND